MATEKTYTVELTHEELARLIGAAYSYKGEKSEETIAAAMKLIEAHLSQK